MTVHRVPVQIRMGKTGLDKLDAIAKDNNATRSDVIREALAMALANDKELIKRLTDKKEGL